MFGFVYLFGHLIGGTASSLKGISQNAELRDHGKSLYEQGKNPFAFYVDRKGVTRLIENDEPASIEHDYLTGDVWLCYGTPQRRQRNLSEEWRWTYYKKIKQMPIGHKTVINDIMIRYQPDKNIVKSDESNMWNELCYAYGQWYKDIRTADLYVKRCIKCKDGKRRQFYMLITNGYLVRITEDAYDQDIANNTFDEDMLKETIKEFNSDRVMPKKTDPWYEWENFYLDSAHDYALPCNQDEREMMGELAPRF